MIYWALTNTCWTKWIQTWRVGVFLLLALSCISWVSFKRFWPSLADSCNCSQQVPWTLQDGFVPHLGPCHLLICWKMKASANTKSLGKELYKRNKTIIEKKNVIGWSHSSSPWGGLWRVSTPGGNRTGQQVHLGFTWNTFIELYKQSAWSLWTGWPQPQHRGNILALHRGGWMRWLS